jgi:hypothetical protein
MGEGQERISHSFGEMSEQRDQDRRAEVKELFTETLEGKFDKVPTVSFEAPELQGINGPITVSSLADRKAGEGVLSFWFPAGKNAANERGTNISGQIYEADKTGMASIKLSPKFGFNFDQIELSKNILENLKALHLPFYHQTRLGIFPEADEAQRLAEQASGKITPEHMPFNAERMERLRFMEKLTREFQGNFLGAYVDSGAWMNDYQVFLYKEGFVLEASRHGNAAYIVAFENPLKVEGAMSEEDREQIAQEHLRPIFAAAPSKKSLVEKFHASREVHNGDWQPRIHNRLAELMKA